MTQTQPPPTVTITHTVLPATITVTVQTTGSNLTNQTELTQAQAWAIATKLVPPGVLGAERIIPLFFGYVGPHGVWSINFATTRGYLTTKQELLALGWKEGPDTTFGDTDTYAQVEIEIDALTGEVIHKTAFNGYYSGGLPIIRT